MFAVIMSDVNFSLHSHKSMVDVNILSGQDTHGYDVDKIVKPKNN